LPQLNDAGVRFAPLQLKPQSPATSEAPGQVLVRTTPKRRPGSLPVKAVKLQIGKVRAHEFAPFVLQTVAKPEIELNSAAQALALRIAPQRAQGVQGVLVLPQGTPEWRYAKTISQAGSQGVFTFISPLQNLQAGAKRILSRLEKDGTRFEAATSEYSASMQAAVPPKASLGVRKK
jgi:hypothetical protein